jgi:cell division protein FtsW (lipid II flippase)
MITKLRKLKLLLHLENLWTWSWEKCSEELLPSSSDFIYAIIVEEYGLIGGFGVLILYLLLLFRFAQSQYALWKVSRRWTRFSDDFQAMVNMAVAVELLPVTGHTADK